MITMMSKTSPTETTPENVKFNYVDYKSTTTMPFYRYKTCPEDDEDENDDYDESKSQINVSVWKEWANMARQERSVRRNLLDPYVDPLVEQHMRYDYAPNLIQHNPDVYNNKDVAYPNQEQVDCALVGCNISRIVEQTKRITNTTDAQSVNQKSTTGSRRKSRSPPGKRKTATTTATTVVSETTTTTSHSNPSSAKGYRSKTPSPTKELDRISTSTILGQQEAIWTQIKLERHQNHVDNTQDNTTCPNPMDTVDQHYPQQWLYDGSNHESTISSIDDNYDIVTTTTSIKGKQQQDHGGPNSKSKPDPPASYLNFYDDNKPSSSDITSLSAAVAATATSVSSNNRKKPPPPPSMATAGDNKNNTSSSGQQYAPPQFIPTPSNNNSNNQDSNTAPQPRRPSILQQPYLPVVDDDNTNQITVPCLGCATPLKLSAIRRDVATVVYCPKCGILASSDLMREFFQSKPTSSQATTNNNTANNSNFDNPAAQHHHHHH